VPVSHRDAEMICSPLQSAGPLPIDSRVVYAAVQCEEKPLHAAVTHADILPLVPSLPCHSR